MALKENVSGTCYWPYIIYGFNFLLLTAISPTDGFHLTAINHEAKWMYTIQDQISGAQQTMADPGFVEPGAYTILGTLLKEKNMDLHL